MFIITITITYIININTVIIYINYNIKIIITIILKLTLTLTTTTTTTILHYHCALCHLRLMEAISPLEKTRGVLDNWQLVCGNCLRYRGRQLKCCPDCMSIAYCCKRCKVVHRDTHIFSCRKTQWQGVTAQELHEMLPVFYQQSREFPMLSPLE